MGRLRDRTRTCIALLTGCVLTLSSMLGVAGPTPAQGAFGLVTSNDAGGMAIDVDGAGHVVSLQPRGAYGPQVVTYDADGRAISSFGSYGTGPGEFNALDLAVDGAGDIWIADTGNDRILEFSSSGTPLNQFGATGSGDGQFRSPVAIAIDATGAVYVVDRGNDRVQKFAPSGTLLTKWGATGAATGQFSYPAGIDVGASGDVYVTDVGNGRIQQFNSDGAFIRAFGQFTLPPGVPPDGGTMPIAAGDDGSVYALNVSGIFFPGDLVQRFSSSGESEGDFGCFNGVALATEAADVLVGAPEYIGTIHDPVGYPPRLDRYRDPGSPLPCKPLELTASKRHSPRHLKATVGCPERACDLTVSGSVVVAKRQPSSSKSRVFKLRTIRLSLDADQREVLHLKSANPRRLARLETLSESRLRRSRVHVDVTAATDANNENASRSVSIKLK